MAPRPSPTLRQRRLGVELRRMREQAGLGSSELARLLGIAPAQITQIETAKSGISVDRLYSIADSCMCTNEPLVSALAEIITDRRKSSWWEEYQGILSSQVLDIAELEEHATALSCFALAFIPGLLQTRPYATALFTQTLLPLPQLEVDHRTAFRLRRQQVIRSGATPCSVFMYEAALRSHVGGRPVLLDQLSSLLEDSEHPGISIRIVPFDAAVFPIPSQDLAYMAGPVPELDTVQVDQVDSSRLVDSPAQLGLYRAALARLSSSALSESASRDFISSVMKEMQGRDD
ncbi:helix-turn-helix domain-containing protein [Kitasatospora viridis]|uniref:Helix-turn-helix protein n=1 Tax=Kitasatospora viridis TaxID=281105 RepID=A0A561UC44_9ACTN|nr:helix-turn-helix transcriptional regulator [Kitasatospora viridis]TWF96909.1 helix-turn-helix protein [Kitasatospora viridis]